MPTTRRPTALCFALAAAAPALGACLADSNEAPPVAVGKIDKCPIWGCGENSPVIGAWSFHELASDGTPNDAGISFVGLYKGSDRYEAAVVGAELIAYPLDPNAETLKGHELEGTALRLSTHDGDAWIHVVRVRKVTDYWIAPDAPNYTYELSLTDVAGIPRPLCHNPPPRETDGFTLGTEVLLFAGDRYDVQAKEVTRTGHKAEPWFNIACAGSVLAKLHLSRHTEAGATADHVATWAQRQALLKMYSGDVCGVGISTTVAGEPLHWENALGWQTLDGTEASIEALWDEHGALCLDEHRLEAQAQGTTELVRDICAAYDLTLPSCPAIGASLPAGAYLVSANP